MSPRGAQPDRAKRGAPAERSEVLRPSEARCPGRAKRGAPVVVRSADVVDVVAVAVAVVFGLDNDDDEDDDDEDEDDED